jgi:CP family cyanate transporter-like MFS transporter
VSVPAPLTAPRPAAADGRLLALLGIVLLSLGMRSATTSFTPVFAVISAQLGLSPLVLGLVGAMPPFAFALAGAITPRLSRRIGAEGAMLVAITAIVLGQVVRALAQDGVGVVAATAVTMIGVGIGNVLLPSFAKRYFAGRVGPITAVYTTLFAIGGASPAFFAVPISEAIGWRPTLTIWAVTVALAAIPWVALARSSRHVPLTPVDLAGLPDVSVMDVVPEPVAEPVLRLARAPIARGLAVVIGASAVIGYGSSAYLPLILVSRAGLDHAAAAAHLGLMLIIAIPAALFVPLVAARPRPAAALIAIAAMSSAAGWTGLLVAPAAAPALWSVLVGVGTLTFPLALVQVAVRASTPRVAVRLSAFVQTPAYIAAGSTVLVLGVLHDRTGDWVASLVVLAIIAVLPLAAVPAVVRPGHVDDAR